MFAGTLGRSQFFVRSCIVGIAETILLGICIAAQYEAFFGPPGQGRYRLAAIVFPISAFFCYKRISFAVRRNRHAGGGELVPGLYAIGLCAALVLQIQGLIVWTIENPMSGMIYAGLLNIVLSGVWFHLLFEAPASGAAETGSGTQAARSGRLNEGGMASASSQLSLAMEQAISGERPVPAMPAPVRPQGFLQSARHAPPPRQRAEFGRRGAR